MATYSKLRKQYFRADGDLHEVMMFSDKNGNIVNTAGDAANINLAAGLIDGYSFNHKFGAVPQMSQNTNGTIWDIEDTLYPWEAFSTPAAATVLAVDAGDASGTVTIQGLDENFDQQEETLTLSSTGSVTGTKLWSRLNRGYYTNGVSNVSDIDIEVNNITVMRILARKAQTLMAVYTVPAGKTAFLTKGVATCGATADATIDMFVRYDEQTSFRIGHSAEVAGVGGQYEYDFTVPIPIPEKSDIDVRATVRTNNARVTAAFDVVLIDNGSL